MKYRLKKEAFGVPAGTFATRTNQGWVLIYPQKILTNGEPRPYWVGVPEWVAYNPEWFEAVEETKLETTEARVKELEEQVGALKEEVCGLNAILDRNVLK